MKVDILAIGVHPDDVELSCSGTVIKHIRAGYRVGLLDLTLGELGTRGTAEIRTQESLAAAQFMGVTFRKQLNLGDGRFTWSEENIKEIVQVIRLSMPRVVLINAISDRHPDHGRAAKLCADACFYAGLSKIRTEDANGQTQERWRPEFILHYIQDIHLHPELVVDISDTIEAKMEAIQCFASQFYNPNSIEPESPISKKDFLDTVRAKNKIFGRSIGVDYGEGFNIARPIGVDDVMKLK